MQITIKANKKIIVEVDILGMPTTKTRIVATIGPASEKVENIVELIKAGASIFRISYSISPEEGERRFNAVHEAIKQTGARGVETLQDFGGLKIRLDNTEPIKVTKGQDFVLSKTEIGKDEIGAQVTNHYFWDNVKNDSALYIGDGQVALKIKKLENGRALAEVLFNGTIGPRKGVTIPGMSFGFGENIKADAELALAGAKLGFDYVALSFVENSDDVKLFKKIIADSTPGYAPKILAKIETALAVKNIDSILGECDGVMIARGDLALQVDYADMPQIQNTLIQKCRARNKFVIVATQMLESLMHSYIPFRAEINDVADAVREQASAVMLSGETTIGDDPAHAVEVMRRIIEKTEESHVYVCETPAVASV